MTSPVQPGTQDVVLVRRSSSEFTVSLGSQSPITCGRFEDALDEAARLAGAFHARVWFRDAGGHATPCLDELLLRRAWAEFKELPGLGLTRPQAQRLWGVDEETCGQLLEALTRVRMLERGSDGRYRRPVPESTFAGARMAKVEGGRRAVAANRHRRHR